MKSVAKMNIKIYFKIIKTRSHQNKIVRKIGRKKNCLKWKSDIVDTVYYNQSFFLNDVLVLLPVCPLGLLVGRSAHRGEYPVLHGPSGIRSEMGMASGLGWDQVPGTTGWTIWKCKKLCLSIWRLYKFSIKKFVCEEIKLGRSYCS